MYRDMYRIAVKMYRYTPIGYIRCADHKENFLSEVKTNSFTLGFSSNQDERGLPPIRMEWGGSWCMCCWPVALHPTLQCVQTVHAHILLEGKCPLNGILFSLKSSIQNPTRNGWKSWLGDLWPSPASAPPSLSTCSLPVWQSIWCLALGWSWRETWNESTITYSHTSHWYCTLVPLGGWRDFGQDPGRLCAVLYLKMFWKWPSCFSCRGPSSGSTESHWVCQGVGISLITWHCIVFGAVHALPAVASVCVSGGGPCMFHVVDRVEIHRKREKSMSLYKPGNAVKLLISDSSCLVWLTYIFIWLVLFVCGVFLLYLIYCVRCVWSVIGWGEWLM